MLLSRQRVCQCVLEDVKKVLPILSDSINKQVLKTHHSQIKGIGGSTFYWFTQSPFASWRRCLFIHWDTLKSPLQFGRSCGNVHYAKLLDALIWYISIPSLRLFICKFIFFFYPAAQWLGLRILFVVLLVVGKGKFLIINNFLAISPS